MDNINWQDCIARLKASGMTYSDIAEEIGSKVSTIGDLAVGRSQQPRGMTALKLLDLDRRKTKRNGRKS